MLEAPFMRHINSKSKVIFKITSILTSVLNFIKDVIIYFLKKK